MVASEAAAERLQVEMQARAARLDQLATVVALTMLGATAWLAWPDLQSSFTGDKSVIQSLGTPLLVLAWALLMQDLVRLTPASRSRLGAACTIGWLPMMIIGTWTIEGSNQAKLGAAILITLGVILYRTSRNLLGGQSVTVRYRGVMGAVGLIFALSLVAASLPSSGESSSPVLYIDIALLAVGLYMAGNDWWGAEEDREGRKKFRRRLDRMETRILELRASGASLDQAASLVMTAGAEGHLDLALGMRLLDEAEDDIERTLAFTEDVEGIRAEIERIIAQAEEIAPMARRPASALTQGDREMELGSLREAEMLYRQAKLRAEEIIEWWELAEKAITEASLSLGSTGSKGGGSSGDLGLEGPQADSLRSVLKEAKQRLDAEQPQKAYEYAISIPEQVANIGQAVGNAGEAIEAAEDTLSGADGMDKSQWEDRLSQAKQALEDGDHSLARGLSDGIVREVGRERAAMDDVRRGLRQKRKLVKRFEDRADADDWQARLSEVKAAADKKQWSHAAALMERLTNDLDKEGAASDEAEELLSFVVAEWKTLRNRLEAASIKVGDEQRRSAEAAVAEAKQAHDESRIEECLAHLGEADMAMEKLRRRL